MKNQKDIEIEVVDNSVIPDLVDLFQLVWPQKRFEKTLNRTNLTLDNKFSTIVVAKYGGKIIGSRPGFKWPLYSNEGYISTYQLTGTCVHPDFRRMGIFKKMNLLFIDELEKKGIDFIFNVSVDNSRAGYEKLGWKYLDGFQRLTYTTSPLKIFNNRKHLKIEEPTSSTGINKINNSQQLEELLDSRMHQFNNFVFTRYSQEFLEWRLSNAVEGYRFTVIEGVGLIIYKVFENNNIKQILIGDFFLIEKEYRAFKTLFDKMEATESPDIIFTYLHNTHPYYKFYRKKIFFPNPLKLNLNFGTRIISSFNHNITSSNLALSALDIDTF